MGKKNKKRVLSLPSYASPVNMLLSLGEAEIRKEKWFDYCALGLGENDIPELTRMIEDERCWEYGGDAGWAPYHARRALGQLRAVQAIPELLHIFEEDNDWRFEDMPMIFALIGEPALAPLCEYLSSPNDNFWAHMAASSSLAEIALKHPDLQAQVLQCLRAKLEKYEDNYYTLNASIISDLTDLYDFDSLPLIRRAFAAGMVDEEMIDYKDVCTEFSLS